VVIPYLSENYGASRDPPEKEIPMCTVRNLPYLIEHTIEFTIGKFKEVFGEVCFFVVHVFSSVLF
jgi:ubiquitin-activating enzyme E1